MNLGVESNNDESSLEVPPILSDIVKEIQEYIVRLDNLSLYHIDKTQRYYARKPNCLSLLRADLSPAGTTLLVENDPFTVCTKYNREINVQGIGETVRNSMSLSRIPGPPEEGVKGNTSNFLFWPGGFEQKEKSKQTCDINLETNLLTKPVGFKEGIEFHDDNCTPKFLNKKVSKKINKSRKKESNEKPVDIFSTINSEASQVGPWPPKINMPNKTTDIDLRDIDDVINQILINEVHLNKEVLKISEHSSDTKMEWAERVDVSIPILDFKQRVPNPALIFPYELDTFQKQAIVKLEEDCNVFVAAHTSAGKTTIAEYAIALTQRHMTKTVYTSPIKALSNQKFRDFKDKFDNVGLITGDVQINQSAACLIMTTEILQTMLYCASDVIRDLEYVIFDEVHYINNEERGHVWEEIVILLPSSVNIIMLSATIPNPLKFANWVGQIKKKKMYVISTEKRPVPLEHYLYTGNCEKSKDQQYCILDKENKFLRTGVNMAKKMVDAKSKAAIIKKKASKNTSENKNVPVDKKNLTIVNTKYITNGNIKNVAVTNGNADQIVNANMQLVQKPEVTKARMEVPHEDRVMWSSVIDHLQENDQLPAVVFMFSRVRCDITVDTIGKSLLNEDELSEVSAFFTKSIKRLNESDRRLPQVLKMQTLIQNGIGIHHSGILPILKEIVEMLFQKSLVKLLFATETFAMGVNMPARTVVFDSIRKFDGVSHRNLHPSEYIQMAGRAGRRGHDTIGTVIILCRQIPCEGRLLQTMCGEPQQLVSKFRVTYSMILHFRRLSDSVSVKDMMRRSFQEANSLMREKEVKAELVQVESELRNIPRDKTFTHMASFHEIGKQFIMCWKKIRPQVLANSMVSMPKGRVLIISYKHHLKKLGVLLDITLIEKETFYIVLVLSNSTISAQERRAMDRSEEINNIIALMPRELFHPNGEVSFEVLCLPSYAITEITGVHIVSDFNYILRDWKRQERQKRKDNGPASITLRLVQELMRINAEAIQSSWGSLTPFVQPNYMNINFSTMNSWMKLHSRLKKKVESTDPKNFEQKFEAYFQRSALESRQNILRRMLSDEYMQNYPEYVGRVAILKELGYLDQSEQVTLKGRVALEMQSHELLLTELIFNNILVNWQPAEIAALLSALVFPQRGKDRELTTNPRYLQLQNQLETEYNALVKLEECYNLDPLPPLSYKLVHVVHEWAEAKSFADIIKLTDVQEGIIVRCIQQLNEILRYLKNASVIIGNPVLQEKTMEALRKIKRDIVFTESLYTQEE